MDKDIHYYCVCVLAKAAGFSEADALTIGYASQYVDDSTESEPIQVGVFGNYGGVPANPHLWVIGRGNACRKIRP